jgi:hypothetical protein
MYFNDTKTLLRLTLVPFIVAGTLAACGSSDSSGGGAAGGAGGGGPAGDGLVVHGRIVEASSGGGTPSPLSDADVAAGIDLNKDGTIADNEMVHATSDENGDYQIGVNVAAGDRVVLSYRYEGLATQYRTIVAGGNGEAIVNVTLNELKALKCTQGSCTIEGSQLKIDGLPDGASGSARVFNPVTQPEAFPGGFEESTGKLLISGVFSAVELTDANGDPIHELSSPATLRMTMPIDTWGIVTDIQPGSDRIEVPLYAFDENLGTWVRDGEGYLEDGTGAIIPESNLPSIRDGSFQGIVVATGEVNHFSYWNVDWPIDKHGCVTAQILDANGNPAAGATVSVRGTTYNGTSSPQTTGPDGRFSVDVMRSEDAGEDVDQDGITGETQSVSVRITYEGKVYDGGTFEVGKDQATSSEGGCTDLGTIQLTADKMLQVALCSITGTVRDKGGHAVAGATVHAYDDTIESEVLATVCGEYYENCTFAVTSGADGSFTATVAMIDGLTIFGMLSTQPEPNHTQSRYGERWIDRCPTESVTLTLDQGYDSYDLTLTVNGNQISWTPAVPVEFLYAIDAQSSYKWVISANGAPGIASPVTYGVVPANASQTFPYDQSTPAPLASGDHIYILSSNGTTPDGYTIIVYKDATVP